MAGPHPFDSFPQRVRPVRCEPGCGRPGHPVERWHCAYCAVPLWESSHKRVRIHPPPFCMDVRVLTSGHTLS